MVKSWKNKNIKKSLIFNKALFLFKPLNYISKNNYNYKPREYNLLMDPIKEAFINIKRDILFLKNEIKDIKNYLWPLSCILDADKSFQIKLITTKITKDTKDEIWWAVQSRDRMRAWGTSWTGTGPIGINLWAVTCAWVQT